MGVGRRLGDEDSVGLVGRLDKVMRADIAHDLGAGVDVDVELLLQLLRIVRNSTGT